MIRDSFDTIQGRFEKQDLKKGEFPFGFDYLIWQVVIFLIISNIAIKSLISKIQ